MLKHCCSSSECGRKNVWVNTIDDVMKNLLIIFSLLVYCAGDAFAQVTVEQKIDTMQILIGEQTRLTVSVSLKKGQKLLFPEYKYKQEITPGLEVLEGKTPDTLGLDGDMIKVSKTYVLTSFNENLYHIPSLNVKVDGKKYQTRDLALKVLTVPVDTVHADKYFPPKDVQDNPFSWDEWSKVLGASIVFALLFSLAIYIAMRLKANKPVVKSVRLVRYQPPHQKALKGIDKLKTDNSAQSDNQKDYYTKLTDILRKYIAERFGFDAMEMTSSEIISHLRAQGNGAIDEVVNLFRTADLVKFARHSVLANENDANLLNALSFINDTKTEEKETVKVVENDEDKIKRNGRTMMKVFCLLVFVASIVSLGIVIYMVYSLT